MHPGSSYRRGHNRGRGGDGSNHTAAQSSATVGVPMSQPSAVLAALASANPHAVVSASPVQQQQQFYHSNHHQQHQPQPQQHHQQHQPQQHQHRSAHQNNNGGGNHTAPQQRQYHVDPQQQHQPRYPPTMTAPHQGPHHPAAVNNRRGLNEGTSLDRNAKKDYDAIVKAFIDDHTLTEIEFPSTLTPTERHHVHKLAMHFNLDHKSSGVGTARTLKLTKKAVIVAQHHLGGPHDHRKKLFADGRDHHNQQQQQRVKTVDMYQGAQFLHDSWFDENAEPLLSNQLAPLHSNMVKVIKAQLQHTRPPRPFRSVQPGLSAAPKAPSIADGQLRELTAFRNKLPTTLQKARIVDAVRQNRVTVVSGDTGCGKTTQIPQMLYDSGILSRSDSILCTQPRRISALSVAARVAMERGQACGDEVGYIIRFENMTSPTTRVVYCTTGILLRRLHSDPTLHGVSCVVVDEVHERDVDTDFALLLLREILLKDPKRNLKVVVMSATIQIDRLVDYFLSANGGRKPPLISIPGTLFPVEEYWLDDALQWLRLPASAAPAMLLQQQQEAQAARTATTTTTGGKHAAYDKVKTTALSEIDKELEAVVPYDVIVKLIEMFDAQNRNDHKRAVLVFLPGWGPIDRVATALRRTGGKFSVFMLHSSISAAEQARVFYPPPRGFRKVVLATNVAETSITIDDVVFVIDSGLSKGTAYDVAGNTSSLTSQLIAKANGIQRRGRAGRCRAGMCVHLLPRATYDRLPDFLPPEILRTSLEEICLQIKAIKPDEKCVDVLSQALDAPPRNAIEHAVKFLMDIGALDPREAPTNLGRALATLPIHPALGKMLLLSCCFGVLEPVAIIAASLSSKSPFIKPMPYQQDELAAIRREFDQGDLSDHLVSLRVFSEWKRQGCQVDFAMRHMCDHSTLRSMERTAGQLTRLVVQSGFLKKVPREEQLWYASRHQTNTGLVRLVLLWSLMPRVAVMERHKTRAKGDVFCWDNKPTQVHPSSILFKRKQQEFKHREFFVYYERMRIESQLQIFDATTVSRLGLLLCAKHVEVHPVTSLSVPHVLEDEESKFGPFDGMKDFRGVRFVFEGFGSPTEDGAIEQEQQAQQQQGRHDDDDNGEDEGGDATARQRLNPDAWSVAIVDDGVKCFLLPNVHAIALRTLRECMDFYFSVAMKFVDAAQFPQSLVDAIGQAIAFPVRLEPKPRQLQLQQQGANADADTTSSSMPSSAVTASTAKWMSATYSDDDVDDKLLGEEATMEELVTPTSTTPTATLDAFHTTDIRDVDIVDETRRHNLYDAFGDLAIIRRAMLMHSDALLMRKAEGGAGAAAAVPALPVDKAPKAVPQAASTPAEGASPSHGAKQRDLQARAAATPHHDAAKAAPTSVVALASAVTGTMVQDDDDDDDDVVVLQPGAGL